MDPKVVTVIVTGVVAVGTLLYYLFFDNKNEPQQHISKRRPPSSGTSSRNTQSYEEVIQTQELRRSRSRYRSSPPPNRRANTRNTVVSGRDNTVQPEETVTAVVTPTNNSNDLIPSSLPAVSNESNTSNTDGRCTDPNSNPLISDEIKSDVISQTVNTAQPEETVTETVTHLNNSNDLIASTNTDGRSTDPFSKPSTSADNSTETVSKPPTHEDRSVSVPHTTADKSLDSTLPGPSASSEDHSDSLILSDEPAASSSSRAQPRSKSVVKIDRMIKKSSNEVQTNADSDNLNSLCLVCAELAVTLQPCEHKVLCGNHVNVYMERAKLRSLNPFCPQTGCEEIISGFI